MHNVLINGQKMEEYRRNHLMSNSGEWNWRPRGLQTMGKDGDSFLKYILLENFQHMQVKQ